MNYCITHDEEVARLLDRFEGAGRWAKLAAYLNAHMGVLQTRAQVLLTLCGAVVTVTGFSGRLVAKTGVAAQVLIVGGLALVLIAAAMCVFRVLPIHWLSQLPGDADEVWLSNALRYRDAKTRDYRRAIVLLLIGLTLYIGAMVLMLLSPDAAPVLNSTR